MIKPLEGFTPEDLKPKEIVEHLDKYIIGQADAKKAFAIALRNRFRRKKVEEPLQSEILPKNILMIGPTGVGKTEVARRVAKLSNSPFLKVEATKFTEVGYVGRDVESIVRDLTEVSANLVREKMRQEVKQKAHQMAEDRILDALVGTNASEDTREKFREKLRSGELKDKEVEIEVKDNGNSSAASFDIPGMPGSQMGVLNIGDIIGKALGGKVKNKRMSVDESYDVLMAEESDKLIDEDVIIKNTIHLVENYGIVFIDEIDKITGRTESRGDVSREGVQRDLLPLIEGTIVSTKLGPVKTDHILFVASGAFHTANPADLLPELQGRLPIRVELKALSLDDMIRILKDTEASLLKQYSALIGVEDIELEFTEDGIKEIAYIATEVNKNVENIGARRLQTIMEKLLEDISFNAPDAEDKKIIIDKKFVENNLTDLVKNADLSKFIL